MLHLSSILLSSPASLLFICFFISFFSFVLFLFFLSFFSLYLYFFFSLQQPARGGLATASRRQRHRIQGGAGDGARAEWVDAGMGDLWRRGQGSSDSTWLIWIFFFFFFNWLCGVLP
jgi:ABC-type antimicrobial peptide transport system permease subunit